MRTRRFVAVLVPALLAAGCYTLQPARGIAPQVGTRIAFDVNDAGRVALGGSMVPEIAQIEGRVLEHDSGQFVIAVSSVRLMRGGEQMWSGEKVRIKSDYISSSYERRFSRGRTIALAAIGVGAIAIFVTQSIIGKGDTDIPGNPGDTASTRRVRP